MVGRDDELAAIDALLGDAAQGHSRALVLVGEAGIGKTTLLRAAAARAAGFTVLETRGVESEAHLPYAGLVGLLHPVRERVGEIPAGQAAALGAALAWSSGPPSADPFLLGVATLSLLAAAAEREPVLVLVDDAQWLDPESTAAISFAARRLGPDAVAFVLSAREGAGLPAVTDGLSTLSLTGLTASAAAHLLPAAAAPGVVDRLVAATEGNPLALLELAPRLDGAQWLGAAELPDPIPAGARLREHFRATLEALSPAAEAVVLHLAIAGDAGAGDPAVASVLSHVCGDDEGAAAAVAEAHRKGVVVQERAGLRIRHPLLRSAALELATPAARRAAHTALAAALPEGDRGRVWHLAEATERPDEALAEQLELVAGIHRARLGFASAATALLRSAELTPDADLARHRLARAAQDAFLAGDLPGSRELAERVLAAGVADRARGEVLFTLGMLEQYAGSVPHAIESLAEASDLLDGAALVRTLCELALARFRLSDFPGLLDCGRRIDEVADRADPEQELMATFTSGAAMLMSGDLEEGMSRLVDVRRLADLPELRRDPRALLLLALAAGFTGQVDEAVRVGAARLGEVRRRGAIGVLVPCLALLASGRAWTGDHAAAYADAGEAAELAGHLGYLADGAVAVEMLAWQAAARGLHDEAGRSLARARDLTDRAGTTPHAAHQAITAAFCALCRGDLEEVAELLEARIDADGGLGASGEPLGVAPLLVEAYLGLGRTEDARRMTSLVVEATPPGSAALSVALAQRCRSLTEPDEDVAAEALRSALAAHADGADPFETARTRLLYGARLRRAGHRVAAREHLAAAQHAFRRMDLAHWVSVADHELAATGATARRRSGPETGEQPLTSQETRVALLAATGMSNKEIAAALFLSPRTVERHLSQVFRKRHVRSRTELAAMHAQLAPPADP